MPSFLRQEIEEVPLGHQRDKPALDRQMAHVSDGDLPVGYPGGQSAHLVVRALQEFIEQAEFAQ